MNRTSDIVDALIDESGSLYSEDMGARVAQDTPQELFHWLLGSIMLSARIDARHAVKAASALRDAGLHKIAALRAAKWENVVRVLNENGYARYDESTAGYLQETAEWADTRWKGDLRKLRDAAKDADGVLGELQDAKGLGPLGASIFAREVQLVWDVLYPRFDGPGTRTAGDLGLPGDAAELRDMAGSRERFVRLVSALTRVALEGPGKRVAALSD
jgi:hypothetical protein